jgi:hypothetical protein
MSEWREAVAERVSREAHDIISFAPSVSEEYVSSSDVTVSLLTD